MSATIILSHEDQKKMLSDIVKTNPKTTVNSCDALGIRSSQVSNFNPAEMNKAQKRDFYDPNSQKVVQCIFNSMLKNEGVGQTSRFYHIMNKMKELGSGVYGDVMFAGKGNLSKRGNFQLNFDNDGLIVAKLSKGDNEEIEREYLIGEVLNQLRDYIPNFAQVYGIIIGCDDITAKNAFCSASGEKRVLIMEKVSGVDLNEWLDKKAIDNDEHVKILYSILMQVYLALLLANQRFGYSHHDLHMGNVLIRELDNEMYIPYILDDRVIFLKTKHVATIIDYGMSRIDIELPPSFLPSSSSRGGGMGGGGNISISIGKREFDRKQGEAENQYKQNFYSGISPADRNPLFDVFRLLSGIHLMMNINKPRLLSVFKNVVNAFPYPVQMSIQTPEHVNDWNNKYFCLSLEQLEGLQNNGFTMINFIEAFYLSYKSIAPDRLTQIRSNADFLKDYNPTVPLLDCSNKLIEALGKIPELNLYQQNFNKINCKTIGQVKTDMGISDDPNAIPRMDDLVIILDFLQQNPTHINSFKVGGRNRAMFDTAYQNANEFLQKGNDYPNKLKSFLRNPIPSKFPIGELETIFTWIYPTQRYILAIEEFVLMGLHNSSNPRPQLVVKEITQLLILVLEKLMNDQYYRVPDQPVQGEPSGDKEKRLIISRAKMLLSNLKREKIEHPENPIDLSDKSKSTLAKNIRRRPIQ